MSERRRPDGGGVRPVLLVALALMLMVATALLLSESPEKRAPIQVVEPAASGPDGEPGLPPAWEPPPAQPEALKPPDITEAAGVPWLTGRGSKLNAPDPRFPLVPEQFAGRVVDHLGRPVADARVYYVPGHATLHAQGLDIWWAHQLDPEDLPSTTTAADGRFALEGLHSPRCEEGLQMGDFWAVEPALVVVAEDFARHPHNCAGYRDGPYDAGDLRVEPEGRVRGRVVDAAGRPLEGVDVVAVTDEVLPAHLPPGAVRVEDDVLEIFLRDTSDAQGRFELRGLWRGTISVLFRGDEVAPYDLGSVQVLGGAVVDLGSLVLEVGEFIRGRVVDEQGRPVPDAEVCVVSDDNMDVDLGADVAATAAAAFDEAFVRHGTVAADGAFRVTRLHARRSYHLFARAPGREPALIRRVHAGDDGLELVLAPAVEHGVTVVDADGGDRRADARVSAWRWPHDDGRAALMLPVSPALGSGPTTHRVSGVGSGRHSLLGVAPGRGVMLRHFEPRDDETDTGVVFELHRGAVISGRVLDSAGAPVAGAQVRSDLVLGQPLPGIERLLPSTTSDAEGHYELERLGPMNWNLQVEAEGYVTVPGRRLTVGNQDVDLDFTLVRAASVGGTLTRQSGQPAAGQGVTLWGVYGDDHDRAWVQASTSDLHGNYRFSNLKPGRYRVDWRRAAEITLVEGQHLQLDLTEARRPVLSGTVWHQGLPMEGGSVKLRRIADEFGGSASQNITAAVTGGHYRTVLNAPGHYLVVAGAASNRASGSVREVLIDWDEERSLDLVVGGVAVSGRVVSGATAQPLAAATVTALDAGSQLALANTRSDATGRFRFDELGAGTVRLQVRAEAHETWRSEPFVVPTAGELDRGDLELEGRGLVRVTVDRPDAASRQAKLTLVLVDLEQRRLIHKLMGQGTGPFNLAVPHAGRYGVLGLDGHHGPRDDTLVWHPGLVPVEIALGVVTHVRVGLSGD